MFDYAIGHYQKHPPTRRMIGSWCVSVAGHIGALLILYYHPELLESGKFQWIPAFRPPKVEAQKARNLGVNIAMEMPPMDEIRKYLPDWNGGKPKPKEQPAIVINLPLKAMEEIPAPPPKTVAPAPSTPTALPKTLPAITTPPLTPEEIAAMTKKSDLPPVAKPASETPAQIPKGISDPATKSSGTGTGGTSGSGPGRPGVSNTNPAQQISGVNFESDARGVNLQDYGLLIKELIRGRWEIPSNLREYQGSVTVTFTIQKDGRVTEARVFSGSGNQSLDTTALLAVFFFTTHPLPPLPPGFTADRLGARVVFAYNERR
jgi:TonB family protein